MTSFRRPLLLLLPILVVVLFTLPGILAKLYRAQRLACFDALLSREATLQRVEERFGRPLYQHTFPSGDTMYAYRISSRISAALVVRGGRTTDVTFRTTPRLVLMRRPRGRTSRVQSAIQIGFPE